MNEMNNEKFNAFGPFKFEKLQLYEIKTEILD